MHHSITDEGIHLFGTGNRALDGLGVFMFAFLCQVNSFEVYWDMSDRSASRFTLCSAIAMLLCFIVYGSTAVFGYLDFGNRATVSALLLYNPVKEPEVVVAYIGLLVKLCASFPLISMATRNSLYHSVGWDPDKLPFWKHCVVVVSLAVAALLFGPVHPQYQHGVWLHWLILWRCNGFLLPSILMMYGGKLVAAVSWMGALHPFTYALLFAGVVMVVFWHRCHHLRRCGGRLSAAQCGAPARLRIHGRQQACGVLLQDFAAVLGTLGCNVRQAVPSP
ncbi:putative amino acid transporter [Trypanosoma cruzi]|uniref:Putative amino acid transporter n=1 Tax=Trypanosoma cruzi TaxID=5693 RepID=A0A2V2UGM6_TRYCR|nr:putative amino acid transporter [Trypanosoma cruzi]